MAGASNPAMIAPISGALARPTTGTMGGKGGAVAAPPAGGMAPVRAPAAPPIMGAQPATMQAPQQGNVMQTSANLFNQAAAGPNIGQFMNPYTSAVTATTMGDMDRARVMATNDLGAQATAARAFGGSRHGVAEAETNRNFIEQAGRMAANLNMQGFNTALGAAQQQQAMQSQLAGQGFGFGQSLTQQQMQQGALQQALMQQLIDAAKGQYAGFTGAPAASLQLPLAALGAAPVPQTSTTSNNPGLLGILGAAGTFMGGLGSLCWVAREVYGEEDPRWVEFRHWLLHSAPKWLLNAYAKHGEAFAGVVRKVPALKRVLRPLMDRARRSAGFEV